MKGYVYISRENESLSRGEPRLCINKPTSTPPSRPSHLHSLRFTPTVTMTALKPGDTFPSDVVFQ